MMEHRWSFAIAETRFSLRIHGLPENEASRFAHKYRHFLTQNSREPDFDLRVQISPTSDVPVEGNASISRSGDLLEVQLSNQFTARANLQSGEVNAVAYHELIHPAENLVRMILSDVLPHQGGALFHAAAIAYKDQGFLFCGQSGAGKTTLSKHLGPKLVLSDEMPALLPGDGGNWCLYATPFYGDMGEGERGGSVPLSAICLLGEKGSGTIEEVSAAEGLQGLLSTVVCYSEESDAKDKAQEVCELLVGENPIYRVGVSLDESPVDFLRRLRKAVG